LAAAAEQYLGAAVSASRLADQDEAGGLDRSNNGQ
jgi:hypothetical protein